MNQTCKNVIGIEIRRHRRLLGWSQAKLASQLRRAGLSANRASIAKVECGLRTVVDFETLYFARALGIRVHDLFPEIPPERRVDGALSTLLVVPR